MDPTIKIDDWDFSKDEHGNVYLYHWCNDGRRSLLSATRIGGDLIKCRRCWNVVPDTVAGFVNLLEWRHE